MQRFLAFLRNFWVCLTLALLSSIFAASEATLGNTGGAWFNGIIALLWLNEARRAKNRETEETEDV